MTFEIGRDIARVHPGSCTCSLQVHACTNVYDECAGWCDNVTKCTGEMTAYFEV